MASNLGYIDRLGAVDVQQAVVYAKEYTTMVLSLLTQGLEAKDLATKIEKANMAAAQWEVLENKNSAEIKEVRPVIDVRRQCEALLGKLLPQIAMLKQKQSAQNELDRQKLLDEENRSGNGNGSTDTGNGESTFPWMPIGIAAAAVGLALAFNG